MMNKYFTFVFLLFVLLLPDISKADKLSPKQVIKRYYELMMNSCWCCSPRLKPDVACSGNPRMLMVHTKEFNTNYSLNARLYPSLPLKISNCKEGEVKASCDVTYFIIGEWNGYDPFCEQHRIRIVTLKLIKDFGVWKISSRVEGGREINGDDSNVVSIPYILKWIDEVINADRENLKTNDSQGEWRSSGVWKSKQEWLDHIRGEEESFNKAKKAIVEIDRKAVKYGLKENEVFVKDLACRP